MQVVLFSKNGIHYRDSGSGGIKAIFLPATSDIHKFLDLATVSDATVKQRVVDMVGTPLYRKEGEAVHVFGEIAPELLEKRQSVEIFLPQDFAPKNSSVFYFVFGKEYIVHGVKIRNDNGEVSWGTSVIDIREKVMDKVIVSSISDRMLLGEEETINVSVHGSDTTIEDLQKSLNIFGLTVDNFKSLSVPRYIPPVYHHKDYSLIMLTIVIFAFLVTGGTTAYFVRNTVKLNSIENEISELTSEISKMQSNRKLGFIKKPKKLLDIMKKPLKQQPSAIIHAVGSSIKGLGNLQSLEFKAVDNKAKKRGQIFAKVTLANVKSDLLVDQERIAKSMIITQPWIRKIERSSKGKSRKGSKELSLDLWVQVE
jgi:hypothetical protein